MDRTLAQLGCERVIPCAQGDARFALLTNGDWAQGFGTTCGYLPMFLLWALGCRDPRILNRADDAWGLKYTAGANISRLVSGAKALGAWRTGGTPRLGDPCYFNTGGTSGAGEHVNCFKETYSLGTTTYWRTYDAGQTLNGLQAGRVVDRARFGDGRFNFVGGPRQLVGFVDLDALSFAAPPSELIEPQDGGLLSSSGDGGGSGTRELLALGLVFAAGWLWETGRI